LAQEGSKGSLKVAIQHAITANNAKKFSHEQQQPIKPEKDLVKTSFMTRPYSAICGFYRAKKRSTSR